MQFLTRNTGFKVAALILAFFTWLFVNGITNETRSIDDVPLEWTLNEGMTILSSDPETITVVLRGRPENLQALSREDIHVPLDLTHREEAGEWKVRLWRRFIKRPSGLQVIGVEPREVELRLDTLAKRKLKVEARVSGEPPAGYSVEQVLVKPDTVTVEAPTALLKDRSTIGTLPIDVRGRTTSFRERVELQVLPSDDWPRQRRWAEVHVRIAKTKPDSAPAEDDKGIRLAP